VNWINVWVKNANEELDHASLVVGFDAAPLQWQWVSAVAEWQSIAAVVDEVLTGGDPIPAGSMKSSDASAGRSRSDFDKNSLLMGDEGAGDHRPVGF
jgi:hypothetical protein